MMLNYGIPEISAEHRAHYDLDSHINVTFADWEAHTPQVVLPNPTQWLNVAAAADTLSTLAILGATLVLLGLSVMLYGHAPRLSHAIAAIGLTLIMLLTPVLQPIATAMMQRRVSAKRDQVQADAQASQEKFFDALLKTDSDETLTTPVSDTPPPLFGGEDGLAGCGSGTNDDTDGDTLTDAQENCIGTNPHHPDTDLDGVPDDFEVFGFTHNGQSFRTNPSDPDTNNDGMFDAQEYPNELLVLGTAPSIDPDGDGIPNPLDADNDGDGVDDGLDISPYSRTAYQSEFEMSTHGGGFDGYQYIDVMLRPQDDAKLRYTVSSLDWPTDTEGNIQDHDKLTGNDEIQLRPMLIVKSNVALSKELRDRYGIAQSNSGETSYPYRFDIQLSPVNDRGNIVGYQTHFAFPPNVLDDIQLKLSMQWMVFAELDRDNKQVKAPLIYYPEDNIQILGWRVTKSKGFSSLLFGTPHSPNNDLPLFRYLFGMKGSFLSALKLENQSGSSFLQAAHSRLANGSSTQMWGIDKSLFSSQYNDADHRDAGFAQVSGEVNSFLQAIHGTARYDTTRIASLGVATESQAGSIDMDSLGQAQISTNKFDVSLGDITLQTQRSLQMQVYEFRGSRWQAINSEDVERVVQDRVDVGALQSAMVASYPNLTQGQLALMGQMLYLSWTQPQGTVVLSGDTRLDHILLSVADSQIQAALTVSQNRSTANTPIDFYLTYNHLLKQEDGLDIPSTDLEVMQHQQLGTPDLTSFEPVNKTIMETIGATITTIAAPVINGSTPIIAGFGAYFKHSTLSQYNQIAAGTKAFGLKTNLFGTNKLISTTASRFRTGRWSGYVVNSIDDLRPNGNFSFTTGQKAATQWTKAGGVTKFSVALTVVAIAFQWGSFGYEFFSSDDKWLTFQALYVETIVRTAITLALFALTATLGPIGVGVGLALAVLDLFSSLIFGYAVTDIIVDFVADFFGDVDILTKLKDAEWGGLTTTLDNLNQPLKAGDQFYIHNKFTGIITTNGRDGTKSDLEDSWVEGFFTLSNAHPYTFSTSQGERTCSIKGAKINNPTKFFGERWSFLGDKERICSNTLKLSANLNAPTINASIRFGQAVKINTRIEECPVGAPLTAIFGRGCTNADYKTQEPKDLADSYFEKPLYFDVLPATVDAFWTWSALANSDRDGDGIADSAEQGYLDPTKWDTDGDMLSDGYEQANFARLRLDPTKADQDGDTLSDRDELRLGTDPRSADTDNDGISDADEYRGWNITLPGNRQVAVQLASDPVNPNRDGDPFDDASERENGVSPYSYNGAPRLGLIATPFYADHPDALYLDGGSSAEITFGLNNVSVEPVTSTLSLCLPNTVFSNVAGGTLNSAVNQLPAPQQQSATCADGSDGTKFIYDFSSRPLLHGEKVTATITAQAINPTVSVSATIDLHLPYIFDDITEVTKQHHVVIDADKPTTRMTAPYDNQLIGGGVHYFTIGGVAIDPTSWLSDVELAIQSSSSSQTFSLGESESWQYAWGPIADGHYTLDVTAFDVFSHTSDVETVSVTVDNTPPVVTTAIKDGDAFTGDIGESEITIQLTGMVTDNLSGVKQVQVSVSGRPFSSVPVENGVWTETMVLPNTTAANGDHTIEVRALDVAGNMSEPLRRTVLVDTLAPTSELPDLRYGAEEAYFETSDTVSINGIANDAGNLHEPPQPQPLTGELEAIDAATVWLQPRAYSDDKDGITTKWIGDFNGDTLDDVAIGFPSAFDGRGSVVLVYGRMGDWTLPTSAEDLANADLTFIGEENAAIGSQIAAIGDVNDDGLHDLLIGDPANKRAFALFGRSSSPGQQFLDETDTPNRARILSSNADETLGQRVAPAGDINGDGFDDFFVGTDTAAHLMLGGLTWLPTTYLVPALTVTLSGQRDKVIGVGDLNNDTYDDFVRASPSFYRTYVFTGSVSIDSSTPVTVTTSELSVSAYSENVVPLGDVNGDQRPDILIGNSSTPKIAFGDVNEVITCCYSFGYQSPSLTGFIAAAGNVTDAADEQLNDFILGYYGNGAYLMRGDSSLAAGQTGTPPIAAKISDVTDAAAWSLVGGGDMNRDGSDELLLVPPRGTFTGVVEPPSRAASVIDQDALPIAPTTLGRAALAELHVDDDGLCEGLTPCHTTINDAIVAASEGDSITVHAGFYGAFELLDQPNNVAINGVHPDAVFVDGAGADHVAHVRGVTGAAITNMTLQNAQSGIVIENVAPDIEIDDPNALQLSKLLIRNVITHSIHILDHVSTIHVENVTLAPPTNATGEHIFAEPVTAPGYEQSWNSDEPAEGMPSVGRGGGLFQAQNGDLWVLPGNGLTETYKIVSGTVEQQASLPVAPLESSVAFVNDMPYLMTPQIEAFGDTNASFVFGRHREIATAGDWTFTVATPQSHQEYIGRIFDPQRNETQIVWSPPPGSILVDVPAIDPENPIQFPVRYTGVHARSETEIWFVGNVGGFNSQYGPVYAIMYSIVDISSGTPVITHHEFPLFTYTGNNLSIPVGVGCPLPSLIADQDILGKGYGTAPFSDCYMHGITGDADGNLYIVVRFLHTRSFPIVLYKVPAGSQSPSAIEYVDHANNLSLPRYPTIKYDTVHNQVMYFSGLHDTADDSFFGLYSPLYGWRDSEAASSENGGPSENYRLQTRDVACLSQNNCLVSQIQAMSGLQYGNRTQTGIFPVSNGSRDITLNLKDPAIAEPEFPSYIQVMERVGNYIYTAGHSLGYSVWGEYGDLARKGRLLQVFDVDTDSATVSNISSLDNGSYLFEDPRYGNGPVMMDDITYNEARHSLLVATRGIRLAGYPAQLNNPYILEIRSRFLGHDGEQWQELSEQFAPAPIGQPLELISGEQYLYGLPMTEGIPDLLRYSPTEQQWDDLGTTGIQVGISNTLEATAVGDDLYVLVTLDITDTTEITSGVSSAFYHYDDGTWTQRASLPAAAGRGAAITHDGADSIYALAGGNRSDIWRYNSTFDVWHQLTDVDHIAPTGIGWGSGLVRVGEKLMAVPGGNQSAMWSFGPIKPVPQKLLLKNVAIVAATDATSLDWLEEKLPSHDFGVVISGTTTLVGGSANVPVKWTPNYHDQMTFSDAAFVDAESDIYRLTATSALTVGYHTYVTPTIVSPICTVDNCYTSVQAAINSGAAEVTVQPGRYLESVYLVDGVTVKGSGAALTILEADNAVAPVVSIEGVRGVTITGFTLAGRPGGDGFVAEDGAEGSFTRNIVYSAKDGVRVSGATTMTVVNNTLVDNVNGIRFTDGAPVHARNNILFGSRSVALSWSPPISDALHSYNLYWDNASDLQPNIVGTGELFRDPLFDQTAGRTYQLLAASPAINAGDPADVGAGGRIDIGYYEAIGNVLYVDDNYCATCANDGLGFGSDAFSTIQTALDSAETRIAALTTVPSDTIYTVYVQDGTYRENVTVPSHVELRGVSPIKVTLEPQTSSQPVVQIITGTTYAELSGFKLAGSFSSDVPMVLINEAREVKIERNLFTASADAIRLTNTAQAEILFNTFAYGYKLVETQSNSQALVVNNILQEGRTALSAEDGSLLDSRYNLFYDNSVDYTNVITNDTDLVNVNPQFGSNYTPKEASPAVDAADPVDPVPVGGGHRADIGYIELIGTPLTLLFGDFTKQRTSGVATVQYAIAKVGSFTEPITVPISTLTWQNATVDGNDGDEKRGWLSPDAQYDAGLYRVYSRAGDVLGNLEDGNVRYEGGFVIDDWSPTISLTLPATNTAPIEARVEVGAYVGNTFNAARVELNIDGRRVIATPLRNGWSATSGEPRIYRAYLPLENGEHKIAAEVFNPAGSVATTSVQTISITQQLPADGSPPTLGSQRSRAVNNINSGILNGTVDDAHSGVLHVYATANGGRTIFEGTLDGNQWSIPWQLNSDSDHRKMTLTIIAEDLAGHTETLDHVVVLDNQPPTGFEPVTFSDAEGQHIALGTQIVMTHGVPFDASGSADLYIDATQDISPTATTLVSGTTQTFDFNADGAWYVHTKLADGVNTASHTFGPWYVDSANHASCADRTQSIILDGNIDLASGEWLATDLLDDDERPSTTQDLYVTWGGDLFYLGWAGATWGTGGTLYAYFDTGAGSGTTTTLDDVNTLPFSADMMVQISGPETGKLYEWSGGAWREIGSAEFAQNGRTTEIKLPFGATAGPISMMAFGVNDDGVWATFPTPNPLDDMWTAAYTWDDLCAVTDVADGQPESDSLELFITSPQVGAKPIGVNTVTQYTIRVVNNEAREAVSGLRLKATGLGLDTPLTLPTIQPGSEYEVPSLFAFVQADSVLSTTTALSVTVAPIDTHDVMTQTVVHRIDARPPGFLMKERGVVLMHPDEDHTLSGTVFDFGGEHGMVSAAGVDTVEWRLADTSWTEVITLTHSGEWQTVVQVAEDTTFHLRATDHVGNVSDEYHIQLKVDETEPEVTVDSAAYISDTTTLEGHAFDRIPLGADGEIVNVLVDIDTDDDDSPLWAARIVGKRDNDSTGWRFTYPFGDIDGETYHMQVFATDEVGNIGTSDPFSITVDTVAPSVTLDTVNSLVILENSSLAIAGTISDGTTVVLKARLHDLDGNVTIIALGTFESGRQTDAASSFALNLPLDASDGEHLVWIEAVDAAGNVTEMGPYEIVVNEDVSLLEPSLAIDFVEGAPGSTFVLTATNFPTQTAAAVTLDWPDGKTSTLSTITLDANGSVIFAMPTLSQTPTGAYTPTLTTDSGVTASTNFTLIESGTCQELPVDMETVPIVSVRLFYNYMFPIIFGSGEGAETLPPSTSSCASVQSRD